MREGGREGGGGREREREREGERERFNAVETVMDSYLYFGEWLCRNCTCDCSICKCLC